MSRKTWVGHGYLFLTTLTGPPTTSGTYALYLSNTTVGSLGTSEGLVLRLDCRLPRVGHFVMYHKLRFSPVCRADPSFDADNSTIFYNVYDPNDRNRESTSWCVTYQGLVEHCTPSSPPPTHPHIHPPTPPHPR